MFAAAVSRCAVLSPQYRGHVTEKSRPSSTLRHMNRVSVVASAESMEATPDTFPPEMRTAVTAVQLASRLCAQTQDGLTSGDRTSKIDDSPVTVTDFAAQALISVWLGRLHPAINLVAEETADELRASDEGNELLKKVTQLVNETLTEAIDDGFLSSSDCDNIKTQLPLSSDTIATAIDRGAGEPGDKNSFWILDPIDGTKGFIAGRQYAVALGLMTSGKIVGGILGCPNIPADVIPEDATFIPPERPGVVFAAFQGCGCVTLPSDLRNPFDAENVKNMKTCQTNVEVTGSTARYMESWGDSIVANGDKTNDLSQKMNITRTAVKVDSMAKYGALARGDADLYLRFPPDSYREKVWDHAAGVAVVEASGGVITDGEGNTLDFTKGRFLEQVGGIVASANAKLHGELLGALKEGSE